MVRCFSSKTNTNKEGKPEKSGKPLVIGGRAMYQEFNEIYLKYKRFLPQKLAYKMAFKAIQGRR